MFAYAQDGERAIVAGDRRTSSARLALVAGHRGIAEIDASRALEQVAADGSHIADLW
jgi:hypothetical protein